MSRIGKKTIDIPVDVLVTIDDRKISTKGKYGSLEKSFENFIQIEKTENKLNIIKLNDTKESRAYHGLTRALIQI
jgi:large subunit ribosomal protein L6